MYALVNHIFYIILVSTIFDKILQNQYLLATGLQGNRFSVFTWCTARDFPRRLIRRRPRRSRTVVSQRGSFVACASQCEAARPPLHHLTTKIKQKYIKIEVSLFRSLVVYLTRAKRAAACTDRRTSELIISLEVSYSFIICKPVAKSMLHQGGCCQPS